MAAAARIANNKQAEADMMEIRFRAERRLGELMAAQRDAGLLSDGAPKGNANAAKQRVEEKPIVFNKSVTLAEAGIDKNLAHRARSYAAIPEQEFNERVSEYRRRVTDEGDKATKNRV